MQDSRREDREGVSRVYDVPSVVLSFSKRPATPRSVQGVLAREEGMTGFLPVYRRWLGTVKDDSGSPVSTEAERVTSGRLSSLRGWKGARRY